VLLSKKWLNMHCLALRYFFEYQISEHQIFDRHFSKFRPFTIMSKSQMFDRPNLRHDKCLTSQNFEAIKFRLFYCRMPNCQCYKISKFYRY
jgi:hypothetical protein